MCLLPHCLCLHYVRVGFRRTDGHQGGASLGTQLASLPLSLPTPPQVCLFFQNQLFRGTRVTKVDTRRFAAFCSPNLPPLAVVGADVISKPREPGQQRGGLLGLCKEPRGETVRSRGTRGTEQHRARLCPGLRGGGRHGRRAGRPKQVAPEEKLLWGNGPSCIPSGHVAPSPGVPLHDCGSAMLLGPPGTWFLQRSLAPGAPRGVSLSLGPSGLPSPLVCPAGHLSCGPLGSTPLLPWVWDASDRVSEAAGP